MAVLSSEVERGLPLLVSGKYHAIQLVVDPETTVGSSLLVMLVSSLWCGIGEEVTQDVVYTHL